ncbi:MAG: hypothetical protein DMG52_22755 [Acidobacteria bacterium]|nr:MAG: hypothetical protein DMG52_22755 [Acidobacteriota bacterium]
MLDELRPAVMELILEGLRQKWDADWLSPLVDMLHDDDEQNRWNAMQLIAQHADTRFDKQLAQLLEDRDLRARGMAGYIVVKRWHKRALPIMEKCLEDPAVLIRCDAISALRWTVAAPAATSCSVTRRVARNRIRTSSKSFPRS